MSDPSPRLDAPPPARRTQQERRDSTRTRLLEATVECLVELGYARTTTLAVAQRAEVSQGALFKHFPTKAALLGAAVERLFPRGAQASYCEVAGQRSVTWPGPKWSVNCWKI